MERKCQWIQYYSEYFEGTDGMDIVPTAETKYFYILK